MVTSRHLFLGLLLTALLAGCGKETGVPLQRLAPEAPGALGLPSRPAQGEPSPVSARSPFGLYAQAPTGATLSTLSVAPISPDGKYRATMTDQGAWVVRIDGAWLWQIELPAPPPLPPTDRVGPKPPATAEGPKTPVVVGPLSWNNQGALVFQDDHREWYMAIPELASVKHMPAALQGKEQVSFSPNGKQVLYYSTGKTGKQLWVADSEGKEAKLMGENVIGQWDSAGILMVQKVTPPPPTPTGGPGGPTPPAPPKP